MQGIPLGVSDRLQEALQSVRSAGERMASAFGGALSVSETLRETVYPDAAAAEVRQAGDAAASRRENAVGGGAIERLLTQIRQRLDNMEIRMYGKKVGEMVSGDVNRQLGSRADLEEMGVV